MATSGINIVQTTGQLILRAYLVDNVGSIVSTGTCELRLYELQDDGTLHSYDFNDDTFKSTALTTETETMVHQQGNNGTTNTGIWTFEQDVLSDFNEGQVYIAQVVNSNATPTVQTRQFQFGGAEGDLTVTSNSNLQVDLNLTQTLESSPTTDTVGDGLKNAHLYLPPRYIFTTTATSDSDSTNVVMASTGGTVIDDEYNNLLCVVQDESDSGRRQARLVSDFIQSTSTLVLSSALDFTPTTSDPIELYAVSTTDISSELLKLTTGFGAASPNNLKAHLNAMSSSAAPSPSSGFGTYDSTTDSLEAQGSCLTDIKGAGFSTGSDSLTVLRDTIDNLLAPAVVTSSALSGSGFLSDCVSLIRKATDEPSTQPKYTDADIVEYIHAAFDTEIADINIITDNAIKARMDINVVDGQQYYCLPPNCASVYKLAKIVTATNTPQWEVYPGSEWNFSGHGFSLEGNNIRLLRDWNESLTLQVTYVVNGETAIHKATADAATASTITFPSSVTDGTLDTRKNAYAGYIVRILESDQGRVEERIITDYNNETGVATISENWDTTPTGTIVYEVLPQYSRLLKHVVCLRVSMDILGQEGLGQKLQIQERIYAAKKSALRRFLNSKQGRFPHHMEGDTADNLNRGGFFGELN